MLEKEALQTRKPIKGSRKMQCRAQLLKKQQMCFSESMREILKIKPTYTGICGEDKTPMLPDGLHLLS